MPSTHAPCELIDILDRSLDKGVVVDGWVDCRLDRMDFVREWRFVVAETAVRLLYDAPVVRQSRRPREDRGFAQRVFAKLHPEPPPGRPKQKKG